MDSTDLVNGSVAGRKNSHGNGHTRSACRQGFACAGHPSGDAGLTSADQLRPFHARLANGDQDAWGELAQRLYTPLLRIVARRYSWVYDKHSLADAVTGALERYRTHPERYRPECGSLLAYLVSVARGELCHGRRKEASRQEHEVSCSQRNKEKSEFLGAKCRRVGNIEIEAVELQTKINEIINSLRPQDRLFLRVFLAPGGTVDALASVLGVESLPIEKQRQAIKRTWDRILKELKRRGAGLPRELLEGVPVTSIGIVNVDNGEDHSPMEGAPQNQWINGLAILK